MGYRCDVRIATTAKGFEKIKELAPQYYAEMLRKKKVVGEDENTITVDDGGMKICYEKNFWLLENLQVYATTRDDKFVLFGWNDIKWMGYNYDDIKAMRKAFDTCGEPVHLVMIGEDGDTGDAAWNSDNIYEDLPLLDTMRSWDFDNEWDFMKGR